MRMTIDQKKLHGKAMDGGCLNHGMSWDVMGCHAEVP